MKSTIPFLFLFLFVLTTCTPFEIDSSDSVRLWIEVASGDQQCIPPTYASLEDAIEQLTSNNIKVFDQKEISLVVCAACICPTGIVYQAQISDSDFEDAEDLGWSEANNYEE